MKRLPFGVALTVLFAASGTARADSKAACIAAASKAQKERNAHALVEARADLRLCAAAECPGAIQSDCVTWLADVEKEIPGVIVTAKNGAGADLIDVKVSVDGQPLLTRLTGQETPMDAGPHKFHFEAPDGTAVDEDVLVREGAKDQLVTAVLGKPSPLPPAGPSPTAAMPAESTSSSGLRSAGWVIGGVGVAGLIVGTIAGVIAVTDKSSANCTGNVCQGPVGGIQSAAHASTIGFVAGGVLLACGAGIILFAPRNKTSATGFIQIAPTLAPGGGSLLAMARF